MVGAWITAIITLIVMGVAFLVMARLVAIEWERYKNEG